MEDLLRRSRIFPTFHWSREFLEGAQKASGRGKKLCQDSAGSVGRKASGGSGPIGTRPKEGSNRFATVATWEVPSIDAEVHGKLKDWFKPNWVKAVPAVAGFLAATGAAHVACSVGVEQGRGGHGAIGCGHPSPLSRAQPGLVPGESRVPPGFSK